MTDFRARTEVLNEDAVASSVAIRNVKDADKHQATKEIRKADQQR
jgi:hypothetical protein